MDAEQTAASRWRIFVRLAESTGRLDRLVRRALAEALADAPLSENEFLVLAAYEATTNPPSQRELADRLAVSPAQISSIVERLRKREWIDAQRDPHDRRRQQWRLTESGVAVVQAAGAAIATHWGEMDEATDCGPLAAEALRHAAQLQDAPSATPTLTTPAAERAA
ncbi:MarR family winged helix-turn-helix transcriptional regulator [Blastopirellula retiformator]|uniref:HTH-type transcriptional repressor NicR n=1 Tax=Blastopirellula retiformator TaxID=2527970 RepID=A0A5C5VM21_9BACT|nr:MarR family winged helix-turn-helix transcriptional regulator [Blastopirellula retiformator]TWT38792.1 HTH-type transcriptional repressor NicR [Blastopirellula retiformator]